MLSCLFRLSASLRKGRPIWKMRGLCINWLELLAVFSSLIFTGHCPCCCLREHSLRWLGNQLFLVMMMMRSCELIWILDSWMWCMSLYFPKLNLFLLVIHLFMHWWCWEKISKCWKWERKKGAPDVCKSLAFAARPYYSPIRYKRSHRISTSDKITHR